MAALRQLTIALCGLVMCDAFPGHCLRGNLLVNYDKLPRPVKKHNDSVTVEVSLDVVYITVSHTEDHITVASKTYLEWYDQHLTWSPEQYEGLDNLTISSEDIWTPDITLLSMSAADFALSTFPNTECTVYSSGKVTCLPFTYYRAHCDLDIQNWPYDVHTCTMWLSSWAHKGQLVNSTFKGRGLDTSHIQRDRVWELTKAETTRIGQRHWPSLGFKFTLRRHATGHEIRVVIVGVVLCLMTLLSWLLPSDCDHRLTVCVVSLFLHIFCLLHVAFEVYFCGKSVPRLLLLLRDSLAITCLSLMGAVISQGLFYASRPVPGWINELVTSTASQILIFPNSLQQSLKISDKEVSEDKSNIQNISTPQEWKLAAILLDHTCFYTLSLTYIILLAVAIPK